MAKEQLIDILKDKHGIDLAEELATLVKRESSLYKKAHKVLNKLMLIAPDAKGVVTEKKDGKQIELTMTQLTRNQQTYFKRYLEVLALAFRYCYPQVKAMEVKTDGQSKIAFNVTIPEPNSKKESQGKKK